MTVSFDRRVGLTDAQDAVGIAKCDYCKEDIYLGEEVYLCGDGGIVHVDCMRDYAVKLLQPVSAYIEEVI